MTCLTIAPFRRPGEARRVLPPGRARRASAPPCFCPAPATAAHLVAGGYRACQGKGRVSRGRPAVGERPRPPGLDSPDRDRDTAAHRRCPDRTGRARTGTGRRARHTGCRGRGPGADLLRAGVRCRAAGCRRARAPRRGAQGSPAGDRPPAGAKAAHARAALAGHAAQAPSRRAGRTPRTAPAGAAPAHQQRPVRRRDWPGRERWPGHAERTGPGQPRRPGQRARRDFTGLDPLTTPWRPGRLSRGSGGRARLANPEALSTLGL
jgi:hypothetical protein